MRIEPSILNAINESNKDSTMKSLILAQDER